MKSAIGNKKMFVPTSSSSEDKPATETGREAVQYNVHGKRAPERNYQPYNSNSTIYSNNSSNAGYKTQQRKGKKAKR